MLLPGPLQGILEELLWQQAHVLREEGKDHAHEEAGHHLGGEAGLQAAGQPAQGGGHVACDGCASAGGVEALGIEPEGTEEFLHFGRPQVVHGKTAAGAVATVSSSEAVPHVEGVADVAGEDEGWALG